MPFSLRVFLYLSICCFSLPRNHFFCHLLQLAFQVCWCWVQQFILTLFKISPHLVFFFPIHLMGLFRFFSLMIGCFTHSRIPFYMDILTVCSRFHMRLPHLKSTLDLSSAHLEAKSGWNNTYPATEQLSTRLSSYFWSLETGRTTYEKVL